MLNTVRVEQLKIWGKHVQHIQSGAAWNLGNRTGFLIQETFNIPNTPSKKRTFPYHTIFETLITQNNERILKATSEKHRIIYLKKHIRATANFSTESPGAKRAWNEIFLVVKDNCHTRLLYPAKESRIEDEKNFLTIALTKAHLIMMTAHQHHRCHKEGKYEHIHEATAKNKLH